MAIFSTQNELAAPISAATMHVVCGGDSILRLQGVLADLSARCGQPGVMDDLGYFLSKPGILKRVPYLLLFSKTTALDLERLSANDLVGAVLLYKYTVLGWGIRTFSTNDRSGRGTLVAPAALRSTMAETVTRRLVNDGAVAVLISFRDSYREQTKGESSPIPSGSGVNDTTARWARREREMPDYLPLKESFEATLATLGQRTRRNMRYYRRRAEAGLGCVFVPAVRIDSREFLEFNRDCMYAVPAKVALWRYESLKDIGTPLFMGIKGGDGRWLSLLGGRRHFGGTEILWQMNRADLSAYSLSVVMRSYFIEHEVSQGMKRLYMEGGLNHPMQLSFVNSTVTDLVMLRRSRFALLVPKIAKAFIKPDNDLALMLLDKSLYGLSQETNEIFSLRDEEVD
jgi:hypothetical protein